MKSVSSRGRTIDCFLSIVTVLGGRWRGASNDVKTPDFRFFASAEIGPREHARARSPGVKHSSPPQKVARSPTSPNSARSRTSTRSR